MKDFVKSKILPICAYPGVLVAGLLLQQIMTDMNLGLQLSSFVPIILGVLIITLLEFVIPYRKEWHPGIMEVRTDILFTVVVQILLPRVLAFFVAIGFLEHVQREDLVLYSIWPHHWHIAFQVVLMLVSAEFLRYWLHRAAHTWSPLWRLHAVHHSPDKLYWLNTSRFHPLDKAIQFLFDTLPFILLGIGAEVLSIYFVFYALNGFFQHSNINLRMGPLNYVISSAQLHRWHHSKNIDESGRNYGNNLIVWDLIFGSWYLPKDRQVSELGLFNRQYPMSFIQQMRAPFTPGIDKYQTMMLSLKDIYLNLQTQVGILLALFIYRIPFEFSLSKPMRFQYRLLNSILKKNKDTQFGTRHKFATIENQKDFVQNIPIHEYEDLRAYIDEQELTGKPCLTSEQPHYYAVTSGTTGKPKHIPVLNLTVKQQHRALAIFASVQSKYRKHAFGGRLLAIPGAYNEGQLPGGTVFGSISGLLYYLMPNYLKQKYTVPNQVFGLQDHELKYRLIIRLAIQHANISYIVSANPSTFLKLSNIINDEIAIFANDIENGGFNGMEALPTNVAGAISGLLLMDKERAQVLRGIANTGQRIKYADIWPNLKLVVTWTGGSCGIAVNSLTEMLSDKTGVLELGYLASELRGTITLENTGSSGVPTFRDNYFEFIEVTKYESGERDTLLLDQLQEGKQYYVIVTTPAGLYRYLMNDIIEVTGYRYKTPLIRFIQKGKGVTNITGEKLTEQQLIAAVEAVNSQIDITVPFYVALTQTLDSRYVLYVEANVNVDEYSTMIDKELQALNSEYSSKRASGRLNPLITKCLKLDSGQQYKTYCLSKGQRESQFKYLLLQKEDDCDFPLDDYVV